MLGRDSVPHLDLIKTQITMPIQNDPDTQSLSVTYTIVAFMFFTSEDCLC